jgi:glycosyltransferase involved in cell wall biosynthesis
MRVMQVMAGAGHGGAETYFVTLTRALHRAGLTQEAVIRHNPERARRLESAGVPVRQLRFGGRIDLSTRRSLKQAAAAFRPDVVMCWMSRASTMMPAGDYVKLARIGGFYDPKYFRDCDAIACNTEKLVDRYNRLGWSRDRLFYMPNFTSVAPEAPASRPDLDTPRDAPLLLVLGRLHHVKGIDVLLKALRNEPRAYLWIAGEGPERRSLEALARTLGVAGRVRFLGWRHDRSALLQACDLCVFPSRSEPFGSVTLEAWAHERPLIAAAAEGPAAYVRNGEDGLIVPIDDDDALAGAITHLIDDPASARRLAAAGLARYEAEFTESASVERWAGLFQTLVARHRLGA